MDPAADRKPRRAPTRPAADVKPASKTPRKRVARAGEDVKPEPMPEGVKPAEEGVKPPVKRVRKAAPAATEGNKE